MAFFAAFSTVSSSIGKRLLLFGLRHIDILDKDPADFVSVDVGKKTTLEVRDVGLDVKKLVALLKLKLPPQIQLSKAQAAYFRVTFVLDFGVPQISIEVDGVQIHGRIAEEPVPAPTRTKPSSPPRPQTPVHVRSPHSSFTSSELDEDDEIPTVDHLARSFIREEPEEEIRELEEALHAQSEQMQESVASSDDDDSSVGVGAPLGLPTVLRTLLNTALDRLCIVATNLDIEMEDQLPPEGSESSQEMDDSSVSLNFHVDRIAVDSVTAEEPRVEMSSTSPPDATANRRRMRIENIYACLVSDAETISTMSQFSRPESPIGSRPAASQPPSPVDPRSLALSSMRSGSKTSATPPQVAIPSAPASPEDFASAVGSPPALAPLEVEERSVLSREASQPETRMDFDEPEHDENPVFQDVVQDPTRIDEPDEPLASSVLTADDDRFADASPDDGLGHSMMSDASAGVPQGLLHAELEASNLYDDEGLLDYAIENNMFESGMTSNMAESSASDYPVGGMLNASEPNDQIYSPPSPYHAAASFPTTLERDQPPRDQQILAHSAPVSSPHPTDNLDAAMHHIVEGLEEPTVSHAMAVSSEDLTKSRLFTHDDAESMYMSAISGGPSGSNFEPGIPGCWQSSSSSASSHQPDRSDSDISAPIPTSMLAGSILEPLPQEEEGGETPRPSRPQSPVAPSPQQSHSSSGESRDAAGETRTHPKVAKLFLTIDCITVLFPFNLEGEATVQEKDNQNSAPTEISFSPPSLAQDSIFQNMPGSFSNYAFSTSRRKDSVDSSVPTRQRSSAKPKSRPATSPKLPKNCSSAISIKVESMIGHVDMSTGRILFQLLNRVTKALTEMPNKKRSNEQDQHPKSPANFELSIKNVGLAWFEQLVTQAIGLGSQDLHLLDLSPQNAILRLRLSSVYAAVQSTELGSRTKVNIRRLVLGCLEQDILAFVAPKSKSRRSSETGHNDIEVDFEQDAESRLTVVTRPVKIQIDLSEIDSALGSYGGFSGVLELGNSISASNPWNSPVISATPPKPRGVHFSDLPPAGVSPDAEASNMPKIQLQLGDVSLLLKGKSCAVQLQTTSIRAAVRDGNVRLKIAEMALSGPCTDSAEDQSSLVLDVKGTMVNFLFAPEEADLARLLSMITPSKDPYENDEDILVDILLRQRRKGSVLRADINSVDLQVPDLAPLGDLEALSKELAKFSKVTKYFPDDDRPGILTLANVKQLDATIMVNEKLGAVSALVCDASVAHVGVPPLFAAELGHVLISRGDEILIHEVAKLGPNEQLPMVMVRMLGDEMEPLIKAKLFNFCAEYHVSTIMAALGLSEEGTIDDIALGLASSVATITKPRSRQSSDSAVSTPKEPKPFHVDVLLRGCALGLNPRKLPSKALFVLTDAHLLGHQLRKAKLSITSELRKASILVIDDTGRISKTGSPSSLRPGTSAGQRQLAALQSQGYVSLSSISDAMIQAEVTGGGVGQPQVIDVEFKNKLFVLESCADSTHTLIALLNGLQPPTPPSTAEQYRTVVPLMNVLDSMTGDVFSDFWPVESEASTRGTGEARTDPRRDTVIQSHVDLSELSQALAGEEDDDDDEFGLVDRTPSAREEAPQSLLQSYHQNLDVTDQEGDFNFNEVFYGGPEDEDQGRARRWNSVTKQYVHSNAFGIPSAPLKVRVRDVYVVWNLYDGYDWPHTREVIAQAVDDMETRAEERRKRPHQADDSDEDLIEQDFLFNSVWIALPVTDERGALARRINHDIDDLVSEAGSCATSTATGATVRPRSATNPNRRKLKLGRSKNKKIAFDLAGITVDFIVFPPDSGETQNSLDVTVDQLQVFDHVPSSTWNKFVTSLVPPSKRETTRPMIHLEILTVKPVADLAATELVVRVDILPLRLHVDQDALDFITRFFEFKDDNTPENNASADGPFIQRLEVMEVKLKLDYKPKRVDYRGLRSGHTTEFMNFVTLDGADVILRHCMVFGISSFDKLHKTLNDIWMPDVKRTQLPQVLSGLAAVRPLVNVGSGMRDLIVVPMREYKKDGRIVRSIQKGVFAFAKNTTSEVARLGAKVAVGTQNMLEGAETFLNPASVSASRPAPALHEWEDFDAADATDEGETRAVSNYAHQPLGVRAGLRNAAKYLNRDLQTARDAVIAIPAEIMEEGTGVGVMKVVARRAPTVILRPAVGATKAVSNALFGVGNALDKDSQRKIEDKYKSY
ncbi:hypothetical protein M011DRAFT_464069 [Sporormia fimetaria CBS 119925]|uniref:Autophagy-related protein 2 n=1 Tax=Sporormia fimetaria CBS 119925 TaxID=1340428 RepID=A0A6A6VL60_9PLEO|nr:hypothetical protein M011DRAFT_464069 [Sporormia fimetaria CBS 119925]